MLTSVTVEDALAVGALTINDDIYPLTQFTWNYITSGEEIPKGQSYGQWDNFKYIQKMTVDCKGTILEDTSANYWTARKALLAKTVPNPATLALQVPYHTKLRMQIDGDGETYYALVNLMNISVPVEALFPTVSDFMFSWDCNFGYWRKQSNDAPMFNL